MKLEQQVTSLKISKRLKELGVKQDSLFWWSIKEDGISDICVLIRENEKNDKYYDGYYSAFTSAELGEILSEYKQGIMPSFNSNFDHGWYYKGYGWTVHERTEADARGKMLIYLLEHNLINLTKE